MVAKLDDTEKKIVEATFKILQNESVEKTTTKKIASEAGVNEVTIFRKFKHKDSLIEITKEYYIQKVTGKLEEVFDFNGEEEIEEYLQNNFFGLLNLPDEDFAIIKVAMEEVGEETDKKYLISRITSTILDKLEAFFKLQIEKGKIRDVDARVLGTMCFSMTFQTIVLYRVYDEASQEEKEEYGKKYLDILFNGIKK